MSESIRLRQIPRLITTDGLRVELDAPRLLDLDPVVRVEIGTAATLADRLYPPWHWRGDCRVRHGSMDAVPHTMRDVLKKNPVQTSLLKVLPVPPFAFPCYRLPDDAALVLDGNHRFLSLLNWCPDEVVVALIIEGPLDRRVLPDLIYWEKLARN